MVQAVVPPQSIVQSAVPSQFIVQPPCGQAISQLLVPVHVSVELAPRLMLQSLPPPHVTVLLLPVVSVQLLVPSQVEVQFEEQTPEHVDFASHVVVQPVPQFVVQLPCWSQLYVTLLGAPLSPLVTPPSAPVLTGPPKLHVPPALHVQVVPLHVQSPVQVAPPSAPASVLGGTASSLPQPVATLAAARPRRDVETSTKKSRAFAMVQRSSAKAAPSAS
jgi:hypothetical protein